MSSVYCVLVLGDKPFPNLLFYQILLFCLHLRKYVNNLVIHTAKVRLQNLQLLFLVTVRIFHLECHGQTSVSVELVMLRLVFMKFNF